MSPSQSAITQRGWGAPHPAGRYRPGGSAFSSAGFWSCRDMEGFLSRGWELILPGCGGTSALARGATLTARCSMSSSPSAIIQWGWGFRTLRGGIDPGELPRRPRVVGVVEIWKGSEPGIGTHLPRRRRELGVGPSGKLSPRNGSMSPSQSEITQWGWGFHIQRGGIDPGNLRFCTHVVGVV